MSHSSNLVTVVLGTRPEAIKLAPVIHALRQINDAPVVRVITTGQHRYMVAPILDFFEIAIDHDLDLMTEDQTPSSLAARVLTSLEPILQRDTPDVLLVQGDTSTAVAAALTAYYNRVPVAHVEAGLRSGSRYLPFPEELNRQLISRLADIHFAPTARNRQSLISEGVAEDVVHVTGNSVIDALQLIENRETEETPKYLRGIEEKRLIVLTMHRRESFGDDMKSALSGIRTLLERHDDIAVVFPVHPNPNVRSAVDSELPPTDNLRRIDPLDYISFIRLLKRAWLVITDSGGIQEEAPALGVPVFVLRTVTERGEGLESGSARLVGTDGDRIVEEVERLAKDEVMYSIMSQRSYPYGRPGASDMIAQELARFISIGN